MSNTFKRVKFACYSTNATMSVIANISPLLFITFRNLYGISYSLLGLLVLVNFVTQLTVDLIFSFFSHKFNIPLVVKLTPVISLSGLVIFTLAPIIFPSAVYLGLVIGTVIFSASGGLAEVLISPVIAAIPSEKPEREMSKLHSIYAWGVVFVIIFSTLFIRIFGGENWQYLCLILGIVPLFASILFAGAKIPEMTTPKNTSGALEFLKCRELWVCVFAIFLGGAAECTMAQWASVYIEIALGIPKIYGDIFGVAIFGLTLALGRSLYAKYGKNVTKVLLFGAIGAFICYTVAAISNVAIIGLIACAMTGLCASMLWPGTLVVAADKFPKAGVFIFALMAAGGDLGASVGPQLVGLIADFAIANESIANLALNFGLTPESFGMRLGMLVGALFPLLAIFVYLNIIKKQKTQRR